MNMLMVSAKWLKRWFGFGFVSLIYVGTAYGMGLSWPEQPEAEISQIGMRAHARRTLDQELLATKKIALTLDAEQQKRNLKILDLALVEREVSDIEFMATLGNIGEARWQLDKLNQSLANSQEQLQKQSAPKIAAVAHAAAPTTMMNVPIVIYHQTPADFERQLTTLLAKGYVTISLDELYNAATSGSKLPPKPIVLSFDDGFANQMTAFQILSKYQQKAVYYVFPGGGCIGLERTRFDCGDDYLNWDKVIELDKSGLVTIASHTMTHANLTALDSDMALWQLSQSKEILETKLGHPVRHFAYPYGALNQRITELVRQAGYVTAVTTKSGTEFTPAQLLSLPRYRDAYKLP